ncbi:MAG TPA: FAD-dependent monooxygenase [Lichenihabitans sp.]|jgi:2-polyprenyl-6-methoxyphenol hydroxylase-like FAD-dependent oxidoreductase|nr:FAD-dependent monooxygenase [Lichenihabitans sp.]
MADTEVLIVGAGPTGLVLALWLSKLGTKVRLIDTTAEPGTTSRALAVHARTLELYRQLDLADAVVEAGHTVPAVNLWVRGRKEAEVSFTDIGADLTPYPFLHIFPQDEHERLLIDRLETFGVTVERRTELVGYVDDGHRVTARLRGPSGAEERCGAHYIAGCDGASSRVRHVMGVEFPGGTYQRLFYVADVDASGPPIDGKLHIDLDEADFLAVFPLAGRGRARLIGTVRDERAAQLGTLKFDDVKDRAIEQLKLKVGEVNWFSTYRVHHRVTDHFRKGRAFLLGDAAHIHSPVGGQGMNTGIGDAINLAWKLEAVLRGRAPDRLLDSYETERIAFARRLVKTTDRAFTIVVSDGKLAELIRTRVVPIALPAATRTEAFRSWMFRTISQIMINYRDSPVSQGKAGEIRGGDRLPWVAAAGGDNYGPLARLAWQVHVYGEVKTDLAAWCKAHNVPLHVFAWQPQHEAAGLARDALYLLRPDTYVALAEPSGSAEVLERYFADHGIGL